MLTPKQLLVHVVDDEPVIAWTVAAILEREGFSASSYTNPQKSLEAAAIASPHLLITDVIMPQLSGIQLALLMRKLNPECKVIFFSGQATTANLLGDARQLGQSTEILRKPIHPSDLLAVVRALYDRPGDSRPPE